MIKCNMINFSVFFIISNVQNMVTKKISFASYLGESFFRLRVIGFFFIHIFKRQYDKDYHKVYHIAFYHILKISKSLSYPLYHIFKYTKKVFIFCDFPKILSYCRLSYSQKLYHIQFIIF